MRRKVAIAVVWLAAIAVAVGLVVAASSASGLTSDSFGFSLIYVGLALTVATDATVGAVLMLRRPGNIVGQALMLAAILLPVTLLGFVAGAVLTQERGAHDLLAGLASLVGGLGIYPSVIVAGPLIALVFPDGRLPGPRWRWPSGAIVALIAAGSAIVLVRPGPIGGSLADNPFGLRGFTGSEPFWAMGEILAAAALPFALVLALAGVIVRVRRAGEVERAQLKWFVAAYSAAGAVQTISSVDGATQTIIDLLSPWSLSLPPIAIGIAILRYRLYEIDRIISRTLAYAALTAALAIVYVAAFVALQAVLVPVTSSGGSLAVAASTLAVFALFQPLRRRLQSTMDRRFNRSRYDAPRIVEAFAARLRDELDLDRLGNEVQAVVGQTLAPASVGVWFRPTHHVS